MVAIPRLAVQVQVPRVAWAERDMTLPHLRETLLHLKPVGAGGAVIRPGDWEETQSAGRVDQTPTDQTRQPTLDQEGADRAALGRMVDRVVAVT